VLTTEGAFYVWTRAEFDVILGENADIAASYWNVKKNGNVDARHDIQGELEEQVYLDDDIINIECAGYSQIVFYAKTGV
jgi:uncharacterized protein YyaL (SSP411 family)